MDAHGAEGVDLLGDFHGADFGGHGGADAAGDHEAGEHGAQFAEEGDADDTADGGFDAKVAEFEIGLSGEDGAGEGAGDDDDHLGAKADANDLLHREVEPRLSFNEGFEALAQKDSELAEVVDKVQNGPAQGADRAARGVIHAG